MNLNLSRIERSRLHLAILDAIGDDNGPRAAFAETIALTETSDIPDIFNLADAIDYHVYQAVHRSDCNYAEVDASALREVHGAQPINLALNLNGIHPRERGRKVVWTDAPNGELTVPVCLPADLLVQWSSE